MHEQRFYHEVLGPTINLRSRAAENVCVNPEFSDVISLAKQAATAAYHFREPVLRESGADKLGPMNDPAAERLRQRLCDVVDSSKHGMLKDSDRNVTFIAKLAFEFDHRLGFRFLRTEVMATNNRWGVFELSDTILEFIEHLGKELGVGLDVPRDLPTHPFGEWAETYLTSKSGFDLKKVNLCIYSKDAAGHLIPTDPPLVKFRVLYR